MPYTIDQDLFLIEEKERIKKYYNANKSKLIGFEDQQSFINWYMHELYFNENKCHYCETSILKIRELLNAGIINGRAVRGSGKRGPSLEIDKKDASGIYDYQNCVLSCYYCNNDKSNTFGYELYKNIIGEGRRLLWLKLLNQLHLKPLPPTTYPKTIPINEENKNVSILIEKIVKRYNLLKNKNII